MSVGESSLRKTRKEKKGKGVTKMKYKTKKML
jgi:hypothetical protein